MATLLTDTVTVVELTTETPIIVQANANVAPYQCPYTPAGWMLLKFATDGMHVWRPVADAGVFAALTIGTQSTVTFGS